MKAIKRLLAAISMASPLWGAGGLLLSSCSSDDAPYPSLITNLADGYTDAAGRLTDIELDDGTRYRLTNPQTDLKEKAVYRILAGYTLADDGTATLLSAQSAYLLRDSTAARTTDPTAVDAVWRTPRYINLRLRPMTQGGHHAWGYAVDSLQADTLYLTLHHRQGTDPTAYSTTVYASLPATDRRPVVLRVHTFTGTRTWRLTP